VRRRSPQLSSLERENTVGVLLHSSTTRAEVIVDFDHVCLAQGASVGDSGGCGEVGDGDVGAEVVCPVLLERIVQALVTFRQHRHNRELIIGLSD